MQLILYTNFSKRKNSTKQPTGGTTYDVRMKAGCSTENPVFLIDGINLDVTYAYWNSAYYFVDEIVIGNNNIYELHCSIDVLATYRSAIGSYYTFIERASNANAYDIMVNDSLLSATQEIIDISEVRAGRAYPATTNGCFIIEVMNTNGVQLYASDTLEPWRIIFQPSTYSAQNIIDWIDSKIAQAFDLDVYIGTVKWVPFNASDLGTATNTINIGPISATSSTSIYAVDQKHVVNRSVQLTTPHATYDDFRQCNPRFVQYYIYLPGCGFVQLDSALIGSAILNSRNLYIDSKIDLVSGEVAYDLRAADDDGNISSVEIFYGNISVNVPIGKSVSNIADTAKTSISTVGTTAAGGAAVGVAGAVIGAATGLISVADNILTPRTALTGGTGNKALLLSHQTFIFNVITYGTKEYPTANAGRPVYEYKTISSIPGFIKCGGASLDTVAHGNEKDAIDNYLNSGFYYE